MKVLKILAAVTFCIVLLMAAFCVYKVKSNPFMNSTLAVETTAKLVQNEKIGYSSMTFAINNDIYLERPGESVLEFKTEDGGIVTATFPWYFAYEPQDGTVFIRYLRDDPQKVTLDSFLFNCFDVFMLSIFAVLGLMSVFFMLLACAVINYTEKKREAKILQAVAEAELYQEKMLDNTN